MMTMGRQQNSDENTHESREFASDPSMRGVFSTNGSEAQPRQAFTQNTNAVNQPRNLHDT